MNRQTQIWIKMMDWCSKYWGCHQIPERSFFFYGYQFPVCARCTGIIIGYIVAIILCIVGKPISIMVSIILILPMAIDGILQYITKYESDNIKRFITGLLSGVGFIWIIINIVWIVFSNK